MTHKLLTKKGYLLLKNELDNEQINVIKNDLTVKPCINPDYVDEKKIKSFEVFEESDDSICVPRHYGVKYFGKPIKVKLRGKKIKIKFTQKLKEKQIPIAKSCIATIKKDGGGIMSLECGAGKTVIALYIACKLNYKVLVVVHKTFLQNQWYDRIRQFTDANIGIIRQKKADVRNKDIVIGMLQSISMRDYDKNVFKDFGLVIYDECHHMGSRVFSQALKKLGAKYTLGLSATPIRSDGLTKVIKWYIGNIIYKSTRKKDNIVSVKIFNYESNNKYFKTKKKWFNRKLSYDTVKMITYTLKNKDRNQLIINILNKLRVQSERKIIVLSERRIHLSILKKMIDKVIKKEEDDGIIEIGEYTTDYYMGQMKTYELENATEADIIFATFGMASEGLDIFELNTMLLATPKSNVFQSVGRIMRKQVKKGDVIPLIVDIADNISGFQKWNKKRKELFRKEKYKINHYHAWNNKVIGIKEYLVLNNVVDKNQDEVDLRREYMCHKYGVEYYEEELELGFSDDDASEVYTYDPDAIFDDDYIHD